MQDIKKMLIERKKHLQKECWSNKVRIDEINKILNLVDKIEKEERR